MLLVETKGEHNLALPLGAANLHNVAQIAETEDAMRLCKRHTQKG